MRQHLRKQQKLLLSLQRAVVSDVVLTRDTIRLVFENGIQDRFKQRSEWTSRAFVTVPRIDWEQSSLVRFDDMKYTTLPVKKLSDFVNDGRLEIVGEFYGDHRFLLNCMWMTDMVCLTIELNLYYTGDIIMQWEAEEVEGLVL